MAAYDLKDQEEIENFKYFWQSYGRWLFALLLIAAIGYFSWTMYQSHRANQQSATTELFANWQHQHQSQQYAQAATLLTQLQNNHTQAILTAQATMLQAAHAFSQGQYPEAEGHYRWVLQYQTDPTMKALATQRLAIVQLQQEQYDAALATLSQNTDAAFEALMLETKGDILIAQGKTEEAIAAYQSALEKLPEDAEGRTILKWKAERIL